MNLTPAQSEQLIRLCTPRLTRYIRHEPTDHQCAGLLLDQYREVLYGGAAGGGKSDWLLMCALQYVDVPGYSALLLRRTYPELSLPEGLIPRAAEWLGGTDARWSGEKSRWTFPSGATLQFGHMQHEKDKHNYDGGAFQFIGFDELTHFLQSQYRHLFSRLRRLKGSDIPLRVNSGSNPGNVGHAWVLDRFPIGRKPDHPQRRFIPARLDHNPYIDRDEYIETLQELDPVTRQRLLDGDWSVREAGGIFKLEWFEFVDSAPDDATRVRYWDFAATKVRPGTDPDYTVGVLMARKGNHYWIEDVQRWRLGPGETRKRWLQVLRMDDPGTVQWFEEEGGSSGKIVADLLKDEADDINNIVKSHRPTGSKFARAGPFSSRCEDGKISIVRGPWNSAYIEELEAFTLDDSHAHDDHVDGSSGAFAKLREVNSVSSFLAMNQSEAA